MELNNDLGGQQWKKQSVILETKKNVQTNVNIIRPVYGVHTNRIRRKKINRAAV